MRNCVNIISNILSPEDVEKKTNFKLTSCLTKIYTLDVKKELRYRFIYEANIDPVLRFFHRTKTVPCGWVSIEHNNYILNEETCCQYNITTVWDQVKPVMDNSTAPLVQASFDIECISETGGFPLPERPNDKIIQIATTFQLYGENDCFLKHIICLGPCSELDSKSGAILETYHTEGKVLLAWRNLLRRMDPDILYGYNIFGFDLKYMMVRAQMVNVLDKFSLLGRINGKRSILKDKPVKTKQHGAVVGFAHTLTY